MNAPISSAPVNEEMAAEKVPLLLDVKDLRGGYGDIPVLRGISLGVREGEVVGLLGHNGMGKSTLLKTVIGFLPATGGSVIFDGEDITRTSPHDRARAGLGYVPQGRGIFSQLSVLDNLRFAWSGESGGTADEAVDRLLGWFPRLTRLLDRQGGALSGGEQQLLALARCLIAEPLMMLLDEPTEGIQPSIIDEIEETLNTIRAETNLTMLVVEQNLEFLSAVSSRLMILERGAITGEVPIDAAVNPALIEEFVGFGAARQTRLTDAAASPPAQTAVSDPNAALSFTRPASPAPKKNQFPSPADSLSADPIREAYMTVRRPSLDQMRDIVGGLGMSMSDREIMDYMTIMEGTFQAYDRVDALPDYLPQVKYPRTPGRRPDPEENPLNAWYIKTDIRGAPSGPLEGKRIALKDNVCLAGVPMMNGASTLEGYTPDIDATIVTRILDAGGTIAGKAHCEYFCLSGGSHTNATGPVHNPYKLGHTAGGSSSGSGALVGLGEVEMAIGGDQGGSIRIPASFCGCYGMKPTHGLVPYTGVMPIEPTIDHTGPITTDVQGNALLLEVIAGEDGLDPRQYAPKIDKYLGALGRGVASLRIGLVREGFGLPSSEADVDAKVRQAAETFRRLGATVEEISVPIHSDGTAIWTPIALEGLTDIMMHGNGFATGWEGLYVTSLLDHHANWRSRADELSPSLKISMFIGEYMQKHHRGHYHAKAQNLSRRLKAEYNQTLQRYDLLMMPTLPMKAPPLPAPDDPLSLYIQRAFEMIPNTAPFDASGHPAMSIPCGLSEGLPIGLQLIGKHYDESTIYRAAHAFEQAGDWKSM
ncbi:amidase [Pelagibius sp. Alg239-R121]|uniref:amidase n=1 Tax=Pelagibius sp. Alg239-R121 TaxID=2993448 RepID=UPI0024A7076D|nr:amidase [Pelagibius sp. Alg239-R121]